MRGDCPWQSVGYNARMRQAQRKPMEVVGCSFTEVLLWAALLMPHIFVAPREKISLYGNAESIVKLEETTLK